MTERICRICLLSTTELAEFVDLMTDAEEFLNNRYNAGFFYIDALTCEIRLIPYRYASRENFMKAGNFIPETPSLKIWIPEKKEYP